MLLSGKENCVNLKTTKIMPKEHPIMPTSKQINPTQCDAEQNLPMITRKRHSMQNLLKYSKNSAKEKTLGSKRIRNKKMTRKKRNKLPSISL